MKNEKTPEKFTEYLNVISPGPIGVRADLEKSRAYHLLDGMVDRYVEYLRDFEKQEK